MMNYSGKVPEVLGQHGRQHYLNSLAIANLQKSLKSSEHTSSLKSSDCQSQKSIKTSERHSGGKSAEGSWIFSASDEYLAMLDKAGVIPMFRAYRVNDYARAWAD